MRLLRTMLMAATLLVSLQGQATEQTATPATAEVEFQRSADTACLDCHKEQNYGMHGKHAKATNPNNLAPVTCTNCHGHPSPRHREGVKDVMRFNDSFNKPQGKDGYPIAEQNAACMNCHEPEALRKALWAHDVHTDKLTCTSCHALHPDKDPMAGFPAQSRTKLCVDCHGKLHEAVKAKAAAKVDDAQGKETP